MDEELAMLVLSDAAACIDGIGLGWVQRGCSVSAFSLHRPSIATRYDVRVPFCHSYSPPFVI